MVPRALILFLYYYHYLFRTLVKHKSTKPHENQNPVASQLVSYHQTDRAVNDTGRCQVTCEPVTLYHEDTLDQTCASAPKTDERCTTK